MDSLTRQAPSRSANAIPFNRLVTVAVPVGIAYLLLIGATPVGELYVGFRVINALIAATLLATYLLRAPAEADGLDRWVLVGLVCFALTAAASAFPRQSFDALLGMAAYAAGLFVARRAVVDQRLRRLVAGALMAVSVLVVALVAIEQVRPISVWVEVIGWTPPPPPGMPFRGLQWGNRYDPVLLAVLLYPIWLRGPVRRRRLFFAVPLGIVLGLVVVGAGSRNLWVAGLGATAVVIATQVTGRRGPMARRLLLIGGGVLGCAILAVLLVEPLRERLLTPQTIGQRYEMWSSVVEAWGRRPLLGYGPGAFPWILQQTAYFDSNSIAPRHPDSAIFQLIAEAGVVGVLGAAVVLVVVGARVIKSRQAPAIWSLGFFVLAGVNANPTDFGFLVIPAILWVALATPATTVPPEPLAAPGRNLAGRLRRPRFGAVMLAGSIVVVVAYAMTIVAGFRYEAAYLAIGRGDVRDARGQLESALVLDPGMALYWRQAGTAALLEGDLEIAGQHLGQALQLNPVDDLIWRTLALVLTAQGDSAAALHATDQAVDIQRSDPTNLLLRLGLEQATGQRQPTKDEIAEVLLGWPPISVAPGWTELLPPEVTSEQALNWALDRWKRGGTSPTPTVGEALTLAMLSHRVDDIDQAAASAKLDPRLSAVARALGSCDSRAASMLAETSRDLWGDPAFWTFAVQAGGAPPFDVRDARDVLAALTGRDVTPDLGTTRLNPLHENNSGGYSADAWGYRRLPIAWPTPGTLLPSRVAGEANILHHWYTVACGWMRG